MERIALPDQTPLPSDALYGTQAAKNEDRRRYRRLSVDLPARVVLAGKEVAARVTGASAGGADIAAPLAPPLGETVVAYVDRVGRLEGRVLRVTRHGFVLAFSQRATRAKRLADTLTWVVNMGPERDRRGARRYDKNEAATLVRESGDAVACRILDISTTGASIAIDAHGRPAIGESVIIGKMSGRVVRHHETGIGLAFATGATTRREAAQRNQQVED